MESLRQQGKPEYFQDLRNRLLQRLEENWEDSDTEVLELIDELMAGYCKTVYMSISQRQSLRKELFQSVRKMDILEELLEDDSITEIMVNGWNRVYIERGGRIFPWNKKFFFSGKAGGCNSADGSPVQQGDKYHAAHCGCKTEKRRAGQCSHCSGGPRWTGADYPPFSKRSYYHGKAD